jgi:glyoxylase-like metal-dependent hydrolase (beta-lactamase superfamily II)
MLPGIPVTSSRGALGWCNVVLLQLARRNILFDTGSYGDRQLLLDRLHALSLTPADIDTVFISHFHFDHAVNAELFTRAELLISQLEYDYITTEAYLKTGDPYVPASLATVLRERLTTISDGHYVAEGVRAVSLPGHTPGNTGLILEEVDTLLAGDAVKNGWEFVRGVAPTAFHSSEAALENYDKVQSIVKVVVPGHDRPFRIVDRGEIEYLDHWSVQIDSFGDPLSDVSSYILP